MITFRATFNYWARKFLSLVRSSFAFAALRKSKFNFFVFLWSDLRSYKTKRSVFSRLKKNLVCFSEFEVLCNIWGLSRSRYSSFEGFFRDCLEFEADPSGVSIDQLKVNFNGIDKYEDVKNNSKGVLLLSWHHGNYVLATEAMINKESTLVHYGNLSRWRRCDGSKHVDRFNNSGQMFFSILRDLSFGKTVHFLFDGVAGKRDVGLDFFGSKLYFASSAQKIAQNVSSVSILPLSAFLRNEELDVYIGDPVNLKSLSANQATGMILDIFKNETLYRAPYSINVDYLRFIRKKKIES